MDLLVRVFFEDLVLLLLVLAVGLAVTLAVRRRLMTSLRTHLLWIFPVVCVGLLAVQSWVVTDREAVRTLLKTMAYHAQEGDVPALEPAFAENAVIQLPAGDTTRGKSRVMNAIHLTLQRYDLTAVGLSGFRIEVTGDTAKVEFQARCDIRGQETLPYDNTFSQWSVSLIRAADGWQVERAEGRLGLAGLGG